MIGNHGEQERTPHDVTTLREEFDRIALHSAEHGDDEDLYLEWVCRNVPRPCASALDIGCGTGALSRAMAERAARVVGVDLSPNMIEAARRRCREHTNVEVVLGNFFEVQLAPEGFDFIATVAALHHMPFARAVERAKLLLRPGGTLVILDLVRDDGLRDRVSSGLACILRAPRRVLRPRCRPLHDAWTEHGRGDSYLTLSEARHLCSILLPGARVRRHLFWRYSVVWNKPA